jgi:hypothetical protein
MNYIEQPAKKARQRCTGKRTGRRSAPLVHSHGDEQVVVDRVKGVAAVGNVVELDKAAMELLNGGVSAVDVGVHLREKGRASIDLHRAVQQYGKKGDEPQESLSRTDSSTSSRS